MNRPRTIALAALGALSIASAAGADHIAGTSCGSTARRSHDVLADDDVATTSRRRRSPRHDPARQAQQQRRAARLARLRRPCSGDGLATSSGPTTGPPASRPRRRTIYGGNGNDFIYVSRGRNEIYAGNGNDAITVRYGRGVSNCGPGRDIYHVPAAARAS